MQAGHVTACPQPAAPATVPAALPGCSQDHGTSHDNGPHGVPVERAITPTLSGLDDAQHRRPIRTGFQVKSDCDGRLSTYKITSSLSGCMRRSSTRLMTGIGAWPTEGRQVEDAEARPAHQVDAVLVDAGAGRRLPAGSSARGNRPVKP